MAHKATGKEIMDTFFKRVEDIAAVDKPAKMDRNMVMFLSQKRQ